MINATNRNYLRYLVWAGVLLSLYAASLHSYTLFHTLIELFSVFVAFAVFVIAWNTRSAQDNHYLLFIGIGSLFFGLLDLGHTVTYEGLGLFPGYGENLSTQLWVAFRYVFSLSFLIAPFFIKRKIAISRTIVLYGVITGILIAAIFLKWFPPCINERTGPTAFKIASEYLVALVCLLALGSLIIQRNAFDAKVLRFLTFALTNAVVSELLSTHYVGSYGLLNISGHYFDLFSDWFIYRAIVVTGLTEPATILFRNLKLSEERLRESASTSRAILDSTTESMMLLDTSMKIVAVNETCARRLKVRVDDMVGRHINDFLPPAVSQRRDIYFQEAVCTKKPCSFEDGRHGRCFEHTLYPVFDGQGDVSKVAIFSRDVTEQRQAESSIRKLNKELSHSVRQLETSNRELEAFSYSVSHDLRSPLRSLDGFSLALLEDYGDKLDDAGKEYLERVRAASQRMSKLIDDLLDLSRVSRTTLNKAPVHLSKIAEEIAERCRCSAPGRCVDFVIAEKLVAEGDAVLLRVVLENLIGNAWKFTADRPAGRIEFGATGPEGQRTYFVKDNGAGFDMAYLNKLFSPFQRLHSADEFPGTGIGLATVQRIISRHGGAVRIEGSVGQGATAYFSLSEGTSSPPSAPTGVQ